MCISYFANCIALLFTLHVVDSAGVFHGQCRNWQFPSKLSLKSIDHLLLYLKSQTLFCHSPPVASGENASSHLETLYLFPLSRQRRRNNGDVGTHEFPSAYRRQCSQNICLKKVFYCPFLCIRRWRSAVTNSKRETIVKNI
jgi:hypothetical protein